MGYYVEWTGSDVSLADTENLRAKLHEAQAEIRRLNTPPKDLSDPYPLDGPNVREQNRYDSVAKRLEALERSIVAVGGVSTLEARLTALSETVARNKKHHNILTELVTDLKRDAGRVERRAKQQRRTGHGRRGTGNEHRVHLLGLARRSDKERRQA